MALHAVLRRSALPIVRLSTSTSASRAAAAAAAAAPSVRAFSRLNTARSISLASASTTVPRLQHRRSFATELDAEEKRVKELLDKPLPPIDGKDPVPPHIHELVDKVLHVSTTLPSSM